MILHPTWNATRAMTWFKLAPNATPPGIAADDNDSDTDEGAYDSDPSSELEAFKQLDMSPSEIAESMKLLTKLMREREAAEKPSAKDDAPATKSRKPSAAIEKNGDQIRDDILHLFPGLSNLSTLEKIIGEQEELKRHNQQMRAREYADTQEDAREGVFKYVTQQLNADVTTAQGKKFLNTVLETVSDRIGANVQLLQQFTNGDKSVVRNVLSNMAKSGYFDQFNFPRAKRSSFMSGSEGNEAAIKEIAEANKEKYSKLDPAQRFRAIGKDIFDQVFPNN